MSCPRLLQERGGRHCTREKGAEVSIFAVVCFAVSAILAALAAFYHPSNPTPVNLLSLAVAFLALGFLLQALVPG